MSRTVDKLQKQLQADVFHYAADSKKAAGRALGTIVEIITYYKLCSWGFTKNILIEKSIPEFGRADISHNVEFSLHKILQEKTVTLPRDGKTVSATVLGKAAGIDVTQRSSQLLTAKSLLRNSAIISDHGEHFVVAHLSDATPQSLDVSITDIDALPVAIFECKRVGVEEGMKKGPQSIEKAKQGAYVARSVSALQKVISKDGTVYGFLPVEGGVPLVEEYEKMIDEIVTGKIRAPEGFVLTVGVTSNHGNWFTAENHNKELKVLAAAYDWLLFLTDEGLMDFAEHCILTPDPHFESIRNAFTGSYTGAKNSNKFTKTRLDLEADQSLRRYFIENAEKSDTWFNIITPVGEGLPTLSMQLQALVARGVK